MEKYSISSQFPNSLSFESFKIIYEEFRDVFNYDQTFPPYSSLDNESLEKIESAICSVNFCDSSGSIAYEEGPIRAAAYLFFISKSHFNSNGNKRSSLAALLGYLKQNDKWASINLDLLLSLTREAVLTPYHEKDEFIKKMSKIIFNNLEDYEDGRVLSLTDNEINAKILDL